jgi:hypothetical protein
VDQIVKYGKVTRPVLGISFAPEQSVEQLGVSGVLVLDAPPNGPAGKAVSSQHYVRPCHCLAFVCNVWHPLLSCIMLSLARYNLVD